tara:strand:+ start:12502 stop:13044 length:543 start_codon:yes stop_codon:yes gene_type:complete
MKRNIRCIYIDGIEKSGKTSIVREMRRFLKENGKDLHEINGTDVPTLSKQKVLLEDNEKSFILKENGLLSVFYNEFKEYHGVKYIEKNHGDIIGLEKTIDHGYGAVHFFLVPENIEAIKERFEVGEMPKYMSTVVDFYKSINLYSIAQGLDIRLITFDEDDRIYDIRDKIFKSLEDNYKI